MSDIKVSHGFTHGSLDGAPSVPPSLAIKGIHGLPVVLVWLKDFDALATDAMRWREQRNALTEAMAKSSAFSDDDDIEDMPLVDVFNRMDALHQEACHAYAEAMTDAAKWREQEAFHEGMRAASPSPSVGENASETVGAPDRLELAISDAKRALTPPSTSHVDRVNAAPSLAERFPVGRKVRVTKASSPSYNKTGVVKEIQSPRYIVIAIEGREYLCFPGDLELLPEAPAPWVPKVGDKVRIKPSIPTDFGVVQSIDAHDGTAMVFVDGCTRWYKITELEPAPTDPVPEEPSEAAFAAWKHRVPVIGKRVRALTPNRYGQLGTVNAPAKFDNDADRHGQVVIVSAKMDTGEVVVNGIQWWEPAEPSKEPATSNDDAGGTIDDAVRADRAERECATLCEKLSASDGAIDSLRNFLTQRHPDRTPIDKPCGRAIGDIKRLDEKLAAAESDLARVSAELGLPPGTGPAPGYLAGLVRERDEARAECEGLRTDMRDLEQRCKDLDADNAALKAGKRVDLNRASDREAREFERAYMLAVAPAVLTEYFAGLRHLEYGCEPDWTSGVASTAQRLAAAARAAMFPTERSDEK